MRYVSLLVASEVCFESQLVHPIGVCNGGMFSWDFLSAKDFVVHLESNTQILFVIFGFIYFQQKDYYDMHFLDCVYWIMKGDLLHLVVWNWSLKLCVYWETKKHSWIKPATKTETQFWFWTQHKLWGSWDFQNMLKVFLVHLINFNSVCIKENPPCLYELVSSMCSQKPPFPFKGISWKLLDVQRPRGHGYLFSAPHCAIWLLHRLHR